MRAILISDKPKWCALMMNGDKNIEVRTSKALANTIQKLIDENGYADIYVYCTKGKPYLMKKCIVKEYESGFAFNDIKCNGKVAFKFRCYKLEEHKDFACMFPYSNLRYNKSTCLTEEEIEDYGFVDGKGYVPLYAIHIADLEIFDKPKELSEFFYLRPCFIAGDKTPRKERIHKAPQNFCYVEVE